MKLKVSRLCPNCKVWIERNYGSRDITCTNCTQKFCWPCGLSGNTHPNCMGVASNQDEWLLLFLAIPFFPFLFFFVNAIFWSTHLFLPKVKKYEEWGNPYIIIPLFFLFVIFMHCAYLVLVVPFFFYLVYLIFWSINLRLKFNKIELDNVQC